MYSALFAEGVPPPKNLAKKRPQPQKRDILLPGITPGYYQHIAREPNTNYHVQLVEWQRKNDTREKDEAEVKSIMRDMMIMKYDQHAEKKQFQRLLKDRVNQKVKAYEDSVEQRRQKLNDLLCQEEKEYYRDTVEQAQQFNETQMEQMKRRAELLRARREEERLKVVHEKRIEQYRNRCAELRPYLNKKHLVESKYTQMQQMRENEARREAERELDRMWHDLAMRDMKAKTEREEQEVMARKLTQQEMMDIWNKQIKGKELLKAEVEKVAAEDRIAMQKLSEQLRREEIEALDAKRRKRDQTAREILEQIAEQEAYLADRKKKEKALEDAYTTLAELEIAKDKAAIQDYTVQAGKETAMYKKYLKELEEERKKEQKELDELLDIHRKEIEKKQDAVRCKLVEAKRKLQEDVMRQRADQIEYKRQAAQQQLNLKQAENELLRMAFEQNERLQAESDRLEAEAVRQYRDDLKKQIEHNNILRERERQELERQLQESMKEEEMYKKIVEDTIKESIDVPMKHPFRRVLERYDCSCPSHK